MVNDLAGLIGVLPALLIQPVCLQQSSSPFLRNKLISSRGLCRSEHRGTHGGYCDCSSLPFDRSSAKCFCLSHIAGAACAELHENGNCFLGFLSASAPATCPEECTSHAGNEDVQSYVGDGTTWSTCMLMMVHAHDKYSANVFPISPQMQTGYCRADDGSFGGYCNCGASASANSCFCKWRETGAAAFEYQSNGQCLLGYLKAVAPTCPKGCRSHPGQKQVPFYVGNMDDASVCLLDRTYSKEDISAPGSSQTCEHSTSVAVCLTGHPRSFSKEHVYKGLVRNMLGGMNTNADVFALLKYLSASGGAYLPSGDRNNYSSTEEEIWMALAHMKPHTIVRTRDKSQRNRDCFFAGKFRALSNGYAAQVKDWAVCFDLVQHAEEDRGSEYKWIVRARPDAYWFARHPSLCSRREAALISGGFRGSWFSDQHFVLPRSLASQVIAGMNAAYKTCDGPIQLNGENMSTLEHWLQEFIHGTATTLNLPVEYHHFHYVLIRASSHEPNSLYHCGWDHACLAQAYPHEIN